MSLLRFTKRNLNTKYLLPLIDILQDFQNHQLYETLTPNITPTDDIALSLYNKAKEQIKATQILLKKWHPDFLITYEESQAFLYFLELQDFYMKYKKKEKKYEPLKIEKKYEPPKIDIKEFYELFDDKNNKLEKHLYLSIKKALIEGFIADLENIYYSKIKNNNNIAKSIKLYIEKIIY